MSSQQWVCGLAITALAALVGCGGGLTLKGKVTDCSSQKPIQGAKVTGKFYEVTGATPRLAKDLETRADGEYGPTALPLADAADLEFSKDGYQPKTQRVSPEKTGDVCLDPAAP